MSSNPQNTKKKVGLNSVISWGASVVIIGLMFKILHLQGGEIMIAIGLCTESFLFAILGFASMTVEDPNAPSTSDGSGSTLTDLLATSITPKVIEGLSNGFKQFNTTVAQVNQVAGSFNVTQNLIKEIETASGDVKKFRDGMSSVASGFGEFNKSLVAMGQMSTASQSMLKEFEAATLGMRAYNKNLTDLSRVYAAQLEAFRKN